MNTSIIIPNWNGVRLLEKNLPSVIAAKKHKRNNILEIIVVDDASTDGSYEYLRKHFKKSVRIIHHKTNRGFAEAVNTGARHAKGTLICLLNTDVVPTERFLETVTKYFESPKQFAVVLHEKGNGPATGRFKNGYLAHSGSPESQTAKPSLWASGGSAVFSRKLWWDLGGLDAELLKPFYWEDVDLGYRAWKRGLHIVWEPKALVSHEHEGTINTNAFQKTYMNQMKERNELLFLWKNITSTKMWTRHIQGVLKRLLRHPGYIRIVLLALKKREIVKRKRMKEMKETTVSDEAVFAMFNK